MKYMRAKSDDGDSFIPNWFKFCFILGVFFLVVLILSFRPKHEPCTCVCPQVKASISTTTLKVQTP